MRIIEFSTENPFGLKTRVTQEFYSQKKWYSFCEWLSLCHYGGSVSFVIKLRDLVAAIVTQRKSLAKWISLLLWVEFLCLSSLYFVRIFLLISLIL